MEEIIIEGYITNPDAYSDDTGIAIKEEKEDCYYRCLASEIAYKLENYNKYEEKEDDFAGGIDRKAIIENVQFKIYSDNEKGTLEEIKEKNVRKMIGDLDIEVQWTGYSEYTILGYDVENFTIGNHDLEKIFKEYIGKYVIILIKVGGE
jgi:hypothetical protein